MSAHWSGLAPAVDAHLKRYHASERWAPLAAAVVETEARDERALKAALGEMDIERWLIFGGSYGLPDEDGNPMPTQLIVTEGTTIVGREQFQGDSGALMQGALLAWRESRMLGQATSHYVSAAVVDEVSAAAELAEPEPLFVTDMFTPDGFAVLETPVRVPDLDPERGRPEPRLGVLMRAIGWQTHGDIANLATGQVHDGVTLFWYTTPADYRAGYVQEYRKLYGRDVPHDSPGPWDHDFVPVEVIPWSFGADWKPRTEPTYTPGTVPTTVAFQRRWFMAFMRLCWQQVITATREYPSRQIQRRWERSARRKPKLDYSVLRLRRLVMPGEHRTGTGAKLDHRVLVRAHWRRQHIRSLGPARLEDGTMDPATHRLCWIEEHFRGPQDGPYGPTWKATSVVR